MIRLVLADDHPVVRAGLRALFETETGVEVVAEAADAAQAVDLSDRLHPDVVLLDLQFAGEGHGELQGVEATRIIRRLPTPPHVLILTNYETDADILGAIEAGASGYLLKDAPPAELVQAVHAAASGESALTPSIATRLVARLRPSDERLSRREVEVLTLVAEGKSNHRIGQTLFLSEATVKSHLVHVFTKLGVSSRTNAVAEARRRGLIRG